jgi:hypothetical protein
MSKSQSDLSTRLTAADIQAMITVAFLTPRDDNPADPDCRWGIPIILWGLPAVAKSAMIKQAAAHFQSILRTMLLSGCTPEDFSGIPVAANNEWGVRSLCQVPAIQDILKVGKGVLFLDELSCARPTVQNAAMSLVYDLIIAGMDLPGQVRIAAAANPPNVVSGAWDLSLPMANRFMHVKASLTKGEYLDYKRTRKLPKKTEAFEDLQRKIIEDWEDQNTKVESLILRMIEDSGDELFYNIPAEGNEHRFRAWPSPRTWDFAINAVTTAEIIHTEAYPTKHLGAEIISSLCGPAAGTRWASWSKNLDLPSPRALLEGTAKWKPSRTRLDINHAAAEAIMSFWRGQSDDKIRRTYALEIWKIFSMYKDIDAADTIKRPLRELAAAGFHAKTDNEFKLVAKDLSLYCGIRDIGAV